MSDNESFRSVSPSREILHRAANTGEVLNDHRNQLPSLPIRGTGGGMGQSSAVSDDDDDDYQSSRSMQDAQYQQSQQQQPQPFHPQLQGSRSVDESQFPKAKQQGPSQPYRSSKNAYMNNLRRDFYLKNDDDDNERFYVPSKNPQPLQSSSIPVGRGSGGMTGAPKQSRGRFRSQSFSGQAKSDGQDEVRRHQSIAAAPPFGGILMKSDNPPSKKSKRSNSMINDTLEADLAAPMTKSKTNESMTSEAQNNNKRERRPSRTSIDSEADSHASRSSQETEEDVCFPMLREHVRVKGIDFDEIEEFIRDEKENEMHLKEEQQMIAERTAMRVDTGHGSARDVGPSKNALKYTPSNILGKASFGKFGRKNTYAGDIMSSSGINISERAQSDSSTVTDDSASRRYNEKILGDDDISTENVKFGGTRINDNDSALPERFSFFCSESEETIHAPDIPSLVKPGQSVSDLFRNGEGTWWLDCVCPTDAEMKMVAKAFGIHPLTAEDIRMQETREKVELFRNYYFVCFHTFEGDQESEDYLEPINFYIVVFREGVLSFHFSPILHPANVRRRVRQLRDYVDVSADWICYALIDDITDGFAPVITGVEYEADAIEDSVFAARQVGFSTMIQRIGESRRKVMTLMRLLSGKADVIKMFAKRCQDEAANNQINIFQAHPNMNGMGNYYSQTSGNASQSHTHSGSYTHGYNNESPYPQGYNNNSNPQGYNNNSNPQGYNNNSNPQGYSNNPNPQGYNQGGPGVTFGPGPGVSNNMIDPGAFYMKTQPDRTQPRADIALYLGDIQDHVVTMFQNLVAYEKIFSRSHSNYLAQLQVESFNSNYKVTAMLSNVTMIGTVFFPLNVITGLFGMNVVVPGQGDDHPGLGWFFGIVGVMCAIVIVAVVSARIWILRVTERTYDEENTKKSIKSYGLKTRTKEAAKSIISFPNKYD